MLERFVARGFDIVLIKGYAKAPLPTIILGDRPSSTIEGERLDRGSEDASLLIERIRSLLLPLERRDDRATDGDRSV